MSKRLRLRVNLTLGKFLYCVSLLNISKDKKERVDERLALFC
jgi:hypothetical protein